jgi:SHS2 domain-containing protein
MPYRYIEDIATADVAFEAWGGTVEEMFVAAADATMNAMVSDLDSIAKVEHRTLDVSAEEIDLLLFEFLQEIVFYKDADPVLLRVLTVRIEEQRGDLRLTAEAYGEGPNPEKHDLIVDVKAVTLHRFKVEQSPRGWEASVILDI